MKQGLLNTSKAFFGLFFLVLFLFSPLFPASALAEPLTGTPIDSGAGTPNDPFFSDQWYLQAISAPTAWEQTRGSRDVIVAVLDAGFDLDHPDLVGQYWKNAGEIPGNNRDDDGNGFEDDVDGWDFVDGDAVPEPDVSGTFNDTIASHGTVIAGVIAAAANNSEGISGISPHVALMPIRILNQNGAGSSADVRAAIVYAVRNGAQVINLSFTSEKRDERLGATIAWAVEQGAVVVTAVGNGSHELAGAPTFPACEDAYAGKELVLAVAASDREGKKASFSNYGALCTDISAPGTNIFGAVYHDPSHPITSTAYGSPWEGTSIAAPMVAAAAALIKTRYPLLTPDQVMLALKLSVDPSREPSAEARRGMGAGLLNAARALDAARVFAREGAAARAPERTRSHSFVVAQGPGSMPVVKRFDSHGQEQVSFLAYNAQFHGGVSVAVGDVNGDGAEEIVTGARRGGGPQVRVFDLSGNVISQFFADDPSDRGGILVAVGDTNGDGVAEIFVTPERGGSGEIRVFNRFGQLRGLLRPYGRISGTLHMALGNMDEEPAEELLVGWGGTAHAAVRVVDGSGRYMREVTVPEVFSGGDVMSADVDGDGEDEILVSTPRGSEPRVAVFSQGGEAEGLFAPYTPGMRAGLTGCAGDIDGNGRAEVYVTPGNGAGPHVQMFDGAGHLLGGFFAFDSSERKGLTCAIW